MAFQAAPLFNPDGVTLPQAAAVVMVNSSIAAVVVPALVAAQAAPTIGFPQRATAYSIG